MLLQRQICEGKLGISLTAATVLILPKSPDILAFGFEIARVGRKAQATSHRREFIIDQLIL
jgi:hypothetical protein